MITVMEKEQRKKIAKIPGKVHKSCFPFYVLLCEGRCSQKNAIIKIQYQASAAGIYTRVNILAHGQKRPFSL